MKSSWDRHCEPVRWSMYWDQRCGLLGGCRKHCAVCVTSINHDCPKMKIEDDNFTAEFDGHGQQGMDLNWRRLAVDVAYVGGKPYLTTVDCGMSRFPIWMPMVNETADHAIKLFRRMFPERGPPEEILGDYGPCFKSVKMKSFLNNVVCRWCFVVCTSTLVMGW